MFSLDRYKQAARFDPEVQELLAKMLSADPMRDSTLIIDPDELPKNVRAEAEARAWRFGGLILQKRFALKRRCLIICAL